MSTMACPKCRRQIPFEATFHDDCGWGIFVREQYVPPSPPRTDEQHNPEGLKRLRDLIATMTMTATGRDPKAWAKSIMADIKAGKYVIPIAEEKAREALHLHPKE